MDCLSLRIHLNKYIIIESVMNVWQNGLKQGLYFWSFKLFIQTKTLSRIFEYYCLIKIQNAIALCGFILQDSDRIIYDVEDDSENINNQYIFEGNGYEITLLYEPSIWIDRSNACTNLYSTGYNFIKVSGMIDGPGFCIENIR